MISLQQNESSAAEPVICGKARPIHIEDVRDGKTHASPVILPISTVAQIGDTVEQEEEATSVSAVPIPSESSAFAADHKQTTSVTTSPTTTSCAPSKWTEAESSDKNAFFDMFEKVHRQITHRRVLANLRHVLQWTSISTSTLKDQEQSNKDVPNENQTLSSQRLLQEKEWAARDAEDMTRRMQMEVEWWQRQPLTLIDSEGS